MLNFLTEPVLLQALNHGLVASLIQCELMYKGDEYHDKRELHRKTPSITQQSEENLDAQLRLAEDDSLDLITHDVELNMLISIFANSMLRLLE